jgi:hypothetical protein
MRPPSPMQYDSLDFSGFDDLNLDGLTVTHMRDVTAMGEGGGAAVWPTTTSCSCSTSTSSLPD